MGRDRERGPEGGPGGAALDAARHVSAVRVDAAGSRLRRAQQHDGFQVRGYDVENATGRVRLQAAADGERGGIPACFGFRRGEYYVAGLNEALRVLC